MEHKSNTAQSLSPEKIKEYLEIQLSELETLKSVFCNPGEINIGDPETITDIENFISGQSDRVPICLDIQINLNIDGSKYELWLTLPREYPDKPFDAYVRNHKFNKNQHMQINKNISDYILTLERGTPCMYSSIVWLQENAHEYAEEKKIMSPQKDTTEEVLVRYWIYSHHIVNKTKRKAIVDNAELMNITGFSLPGKPGIICIEGTASDCTEWWQTIRSLSWKKIFCKVIEENKENKKRDEFLRFKKFEELTFASTNSKGYHHADIGELNKYLEEHGLGYIFKEIFGFENKAG